MACHTWVYKKGRKITDDDVELAIQANNDKINKFKKDADLLSYAAIDVLNNLFVFIILFPLFYLRNNSLFVVAFDNVFPNN